MRPVKWKELVRLCKSEGCVFDRQRGSHYIMTKPGLNRPIVIPKRSSLREHIVFSVGRTLGLNRKQIEQRLEPSKPKKKKAKSAKA